MTLSTRALEAPPRCSSPPPPPAWPLALVCEPDDRSLGQKTALTRTLSAALMQDQLNPQSLGLPIHGRCLEMLRWPTRSVVHNIINAHASPP